MYFLALYILMSKLIWSWKLNGKRALKAPLKFLGKRFNIYIGSTLNNFFGDLRRIYIPRGMGRSLTVCTGRKPEGLLNQMPSREQHTGFASRLEAESITLLGSNCISGSIHNDHGLSRLPKRLQ